MARVSSHVLPTCVLYHYLTFSQLASLLAWLPDREVSGCNFMSLITFYGHSFKAESVFSQRGLRLFVPVATPGHALGCPHHNRAVVLLIAPS